MLRWVDGLMGAALTACVALGIAWIVGAVALDSSNSTPLRNDIRGSEILRALDKVLPPSGPVLNALARIDPLPSVHGPAATVPAPTRAILRSRAVRRAGRSVVRVYGMACGLGIEGSGWDVGPGLVVTNAHVVAGEDHTQVQVGGIGPDLAGEVVGFDVHDDIALLRVPGLRLRSLSFAPSARVGDRGRDPRLSARRPVQRAARTDRPDRDRPHPERLRAGQRGALDHAVARQDPARNSGGPVIDARGARAGDRVRRDHQQRRAPAGSRSPTTSSPRRSEPRGRGSCGRWQRTLRRIGPPAYSAQLARPPGLRPLHARTRAGGRLLAVRPPVRVAFACRWLRPRSSFCHLRNHVELECPHQLWVVLSKVCLSRREQLGFGARRELRPTFAVGDPIRSLGAHAVPSITAQSRRPRPHTARALENAPGDHGPQASISPLSLRFQNVATTRWDGAHPRPALRSSVGGAHGVEIVAALRGRQVRLLLAYLVINRDRRVGREELIGAVWPETAPAPKTPPCGRCCHGCARSPAPRSAGRP